MKIAIYDSDDSYLLEMLKELKKYKDEYKQIEEVVAFKELDLMEKAVFEGRFDFICFSIDNKNLEEIQRVSYICQKVRRSYIFLIGDDICFYQKAFQIGASQYLIKPFSIQKLSQEFHFAIKKCLDQKTIMKFHTMSGVMNIRLNDILYVETRYNRYILHTEYGIYFGDVRFLRKVRYRLLADHFIRVHQSYIINVLAVSYYTKTHVIFFNGEQIPISRRFYTQLKNEFQSS